MVTMLSGFAILKSDREGLGGCKGSDILLFNTMSKWTLICNTLLQLYIRIKFRLLAISRIYLGLYIYFYDNFWLEKPTIIYGF